MGLTAGFETAFGHLFSDRKCQWELVQTERARGEQAQEAADPVVAPPPDPAAAAEPALLRDVSAAAEVP